MWRTPVRFGHRGPASSGANSIPPGLKARNITAWPEGLGKMPAQITQRCKRATSQPRQHFTRSAEHCSAPRIWPAFAEISKSGCPPHIKCSPAIICQDAHPSRQRLGLRQPPGAFPSPTHNLPPLADRNLKPATSRSANFRSLQRTNRRGRQNVKSRNQQTTTAPDDRSPAPLRPFCPLRLVARPARTCRKNPLICRRRREEAVFRLPAKVFEISVFSAAKSRFAPDGRPGSDYPEGIASSSP